MVISFDPDKERLPIIIPRTQWDAAGPSGPIDDMIMPSTFVFLTYAGAVASCRTEKDCIKTMRRLQKFHMDRGQPDIPYNFLIGTDKQIYEGRGWYQACPTPPERPDLYKKAYVFAFIGPLRANYKPNLKDFEYAYQLVNYALDCKYLNEDGWFYRHMPIDWNNYLIKDLTQITDT